MAAPPLRAAEVLETGEAKCSILLSVYENVCQAPGMARLMERIDAVLDEDCCHGKQAFVARTRQVCALFAPAPGEPTTAHEPGSTGGPRKKAPTPPLSRVVLPAFFCRPHARLLGHMEDEAC